MITFDAESGDAAWRKAAVYLRRDGKVQEGRDQPTKELVHVAYSISDPRQRIVFARPINPAFAVVEVIWILAGANDATFLSFWNPRVGKSLDEGEQAFHGAYGYRLGSEPRLRRQVAGALRHKTLRGAARFDQLRAAYETLSRDPNSRQVVLQIWDGSRDMPSPDPRSRDVPCNVLSHLLVRDGRLEWLQVLRSNDLFWGTPYNFIQFTVLQEVLAGWLAIDLGSYQQVSDSLHVYERHWTELDDLSLREEAVPQNHADLRVGPYRIWEQLWARLVDCAMQLAQEPDADGLLAIAHSYRDVPPAYLEWVWLLTAEALRRRGHSISDDVSTRSGPFWGESWRRWSASLATRA